MLWRVLCFFGIHNWIMVRSPLLGWAEVEAETSADWTRECTECGKWEYLRHG